MTSHIWTWFVLPRSRLTKSGKSGIKSSGFTVVSLTDSDILTPIYVKKSLNSLAISVGSDKRVPSLFIICSILELLLFELAASFKSCQVRLGLCVFSLRFSV